MITGAHTMFYSNDAVELRAFIRDKLRLPCFDAGGGWLIFDYQQSDLGCHPTDFPGSPPAGTHRISFLCDNITRTVAELSSRGVTFTRGIVDEGYALATSFAMPGGMTVELYEPRYRPAKPGAARKPTKPRKAAAKKKPPTRASASASAKRRKRAKW